MFPLLRSVRDTWIAKGAFSVRLFLRDTMSADESRQMYDENHAASADNGRCRIAVPRPLFLSHSNWWSA